MHAAGRPEFPALKAVQNCGVVFSAELQKSIKAFGANATLKEVCKAINEAKRRPCRLTNPRVVGDGVVEWLQAWQNGRYVVELAPSRKGRSAKCITWTADASAASSQVIGASRIPPPVTAMEANLQNLGFCSSALTSMYEIVMEKKKSRKRTLNAGCYG
jgi:hypothetical protein